MSSLNAGDSALHQSVVDGSEEVSRDPRDCGVAEHALTQVCAKLPDSVANSRIQPSETTRRPDKRQGVASDEHSHEEASDLNRWWWGSSANATAHEQPAAPGQGSRLL